MEKARLLIKITTLCLTDSPLCFSTWNNISGITTSDFYSRVSSYFAKATTVTTWPRFDKAFSQSGLQSCPPTGRFLHWWPWKRSSRQDLLKEVHGLTIKSTFFLSPTFLILFALLKHKQVFKTNVLDWYLKTGRDRRHKMTSSLKHLGHSNAVLPERPRGMAGIPDRGCSSQSLYTASKSLE